jgi:integrase/recombinase XerC
MATCSEFLLDDCCAVQRLLADWGRRAGVEVTPHTLRHSFAKNLINAGVSMEKVAALLGLANLNTTRIFTTPSFTDLEMAVGQ